MIFPNLDGKGSGVKYTVGKHIAAALQLPLCSPYCKLPPRPPVGFIWYNMRTLRVIALDLMRHSYPSTVNVINLQQCMNYMVPTYNDTLFTTSVAMFSAPAAMAVPTEGAAEAAQGLTKIQQRLH